MGLLFLPPGSGQGDDAEAPLPPEEAARTMQVPDGFHVTLFAGEPDVRQPVGFCIDDRGRLWVAEALNYPHRDRKTGDRIVILEDQDDDGRFDKRTVFYDKLNYVSGIEVGFGGAWVMSPPNFYFIPDRDRNDVPDGPPRVLLDGFGAHANAHNMANGFAWGPDGWLYGTHGRTNWSLPARPGTPDEQRTQFDGGVWRYHPVRHEWEPFADGTTNPWGIDFDDYGQGFVCNCVNPHLFHVIQGAHYEPWRNRKSSQYAYERIATIADHLHYVGGADVRAGLGSAAESDAGGGHAHCGTMVYLGDNFPERYRNTVFMNNIHGHRVNNDILVRSGSGYVATHGQDWMQSRDPWFVGVTIQYGPDGGVFVSDWSDTGECHSIRNTQVGTGRIFKIRYARPAEPKPGEPDPAPSRTDSRQLDVERLDDRELVHLQLHRNDWFVRHARRVLQQRSAAGQDMTAVHQALLAMFREQPTTARKLRALWALHVTGGASSRWLASLLDHEDAYVRAWAVRLLCQSETPSGEVLEQFRLMAVQDSSAFVRLHLASALQRLPATARWDIAEALVARSEDVDDPNLPLMIWYGIEPLVDDDLQRFVELEVVSRIPLVRRHVARRVTSNADAKKTESLEPGLKALLALLQESRDSDLQRDVMLGMIQGLEGRRRVAMPSTWPATYARLYRSSDAEVQQLALQVALIFNDPQAYRLQRAQALDKRATPASRNQAIATLVARLDAELPPLLLQLLEDPVTQQAAIRGLAEFSHPTTVDAIFRIYPRLSPAARQDALQTLASRGTWAVRLLDAVEEGQIPRTDLTAYTVRQLGTFQDAELSKRIRQVWGEVRSTSAERSALIAQYRRQLTTAELQSADVSSGRAIFKRTCANCHRLFGEGGAIGPDITGAQRGNLQYLLEHIVDPSAAVAKDFQMQIFSTTAGRVITGLVVAEDENAITIQTLNEKLVVPVGEIEERRQSPLSLMPDGMLEKLSAAERRDLLAYLSGSHQVPLPETAEPAAPR